MTNPWDKIFVEDFESAYKIADQNYLQTSQEFDLRARAICLLLLRKYDKSLADFLTLNDIEKQTDRTRDGTYMDIGLCYYAMDNNDKAIEYFKFPMTNRKKMKYTSDISVPPSVLLFIGVKLGMQDLIKIATKELKRLSKYKTAASNYLLGLFTEDDLNKIYEEQTNETLRNRAQYKVEFYKAILDLQAGEFGKYKEHINKCVELTGKYLEFEYYIAKVEYDKLNNC
jgi:tetratricopeptide (TPR) repeat protein